MNIKKWLVSRKDSSLDYPLIEEDVPLDEEVAEVSKRSGSLIKSRQDYASNLKNVIAYLIDRLEKMKLSGKCNERTLKLEKSLKDYENYSGNLKNEK